VFVFVVGPIAIATAVHPSQASIKTLWDLAMSAVFTVGVVTVVFAILERYPVNAKPFEKWDPRKLPRVPKLPPEERSTPRATAIAEMAASLIFGTLFVAWFRTTFDVGGLRITLTPIWQSMYWPFLAVILSGGVRGWMGLVWPERLRRRFWMRVGINAVTVILAGILLHAGSWVNLAAPSLSALDIRDAAKWTNFGVKIFLIVTVVIAAGDAIPEGLKIFRKRSQWHYSTAT
jgi:hypothetical protein